MVAIQSEIRRVAMDFLARREHSRLELQRKLRLRDFSLSTILPVLDKLETDKLLSDERFSEAYVRMRSRRGFGPVRIQQELLERGVNAELITKALIAAQLDWYALVSQTYQKKYGQQCTTDYAIRAKQARFLTYRGFSHEQVRYVLGDNNGI